jgi:hypothetical protein
MPQTLLPLFPDGATQINSQLSVVKRDGEVTYFHGVLPVFTHQEQDHSTFRMITAQFCVTGNAQQAEIVRAFGVTSISVKRAVKCYRLHGPAGFYAPRKTRGPAVLKPAALEEAQRRLDAGEATAQVAHELQLKKNTLNKAIAAGRLHKPHSATASSPPSASAGEAGMSPGTADASAADGLPLLPTPTFMPKIPPAGPPSSQSQRSTADSQAEMGMGATNQLDRVAASLGLSGPAPIRFQPALDVPHGGVLLAVPALLACGLLRHTDKHFQLPPGYYGLPSLFLLWAFLALGRLKSVEQLRYCSPGEWGKLLGLDRVPEVGTLREKMACLTDQEQATAWNTALSQDWMQELPAGTAAFCVDGHVRVYHGDQTLLPRHYVARQKLCLRATTDYWVNALDGRPFFLLNQAVDPGLLQVLEKDIIPRLKADAPHQPTPEELRKNPLLHRFTVIFDREGYSPDFLRRMKDQRIACLTYHKFPGADWPREEFAPTTIRLASGQAVPMELAERGVFLAGKLWVRELRKLSASGHQTSILATDYVTESPVLAGAMFSRWSQENFFRYMREHYALDRLVDRDLEDLDETTQVVNPAYRRLDGAVRKLAAVLNRQRAEFGALTLAGEFDGKNLAEYERRKAGLLEELQRREAEVDALKAQRKQVPRHIQVSELPEQERFQRLRVAGKHLVDTIKMIAYRAETTLVQIAREQLSRTDDGRQLVASLFQTATDLHPDDSSGTLTVRLHHLANRAHDEVIRHLCAELNVTATPFPGTNLRLVYELGAK